MLDSVDEFLNPATPNGTENIEKMDRVRELVSLLSEKETLNAFILLTQNLKHISKITAQLNQIENGASIATDAFDEFFGEAMAQGLNIEVFSENLKKLNYHLLDFIESGTLSTLLDSGILKNSSIEAVGAMGQSMAVSSQSQKSAGPFALIKALFNKDFQRTIGFTIQFGTHFGRSLKKTRRS